ncbi:MAG: leucine-rich repeat domain-containing protein [Oscillospiraceae bacterium]|nr:leucine-rich repeat domain-containing protein [Oscillospiraceae bacterium]
MDYTTIPQENKAEILEQAVINNRLDELVKTYKELGHIEMTARALGTACRFCGLEKVKTLVDCGATFDIPKDESAEKRYHCYAGMKWDNYRTNYSLYLLNITKQIKGACCCKGLKPLKQIKKDDKTTLKFLPDSERTEVLKYLCENAEKLSFSPEEMLYYAIFARDEFIASELKKLGVTLSEKRVNIITNGGPITDGYWYEWTAMMSKLSDEDYLPVMRNIAAELDEKPFHCTGKVYDITKNRFADPKILEFFRDNFKTDKLNKTDLIRSLIDCNAAASLPIAEQLGWLDNTKRRDDMIAYAQSRKDRVECAAWLLDFKNRTADFAAEREKAEKKIMRELNANPNSVTELKKKWSYKNREDGTLIITNYKSTATTVTVPEMIGKSVVTAIGNGAFAGASGVGAGSVTANFTNAQMQARHRITSLTLPKTIKYIGDGAFTHLHSLESIEIPDGVTEIGAFAFDCCESLTEITVPGSVKKIGMYAFAGCKNLRRVKICEGVIEIGVGAFIKDPRLKEIELPKSLQRLMTQKRYVPQNLSYFTVGALDPNSLLTVYCPKGSYAAEYCKTNGIKVIESSDK